MKLRIASVTGAAGLLALAWALGLFDLVADGERLRATLLDLGFWGCGLYVLLFALLEPFGAPGILFIVPATLVWPLWLAFLLSLAGSIGAGIVGFAFARHLARDYVSARLPERFHRYDQRLARSGLQTVILVRLTFFLLPPAHWVLGLSRVRFAPFVVGSSIGFVPGIAALTFLGGGLIELLSGRPQVLFLLVACSLTAWLAARRGRRGRPGETPDPVA